MSIYIRLAVSILQFLVWLALYMHKYMRFSVTACRAHSICADLLFIEIVQTWMQKLREYQHVIFNSDFWLLAQRIEINTNANSNFIRCRKHIVVYYVLIKTAARLKISRSFFLLGKNMHYNIIIDGVLDHYI